MLKRIGIVAAWVVATFATATITLAAVGRAGGEVSDRPAMPISGAELAARFATSTTTRTVLDITVTSGTTATTTEPVTTTRIVPDITVTSGTTATTTQPATTNEPGSTTSTTPPTTTTGAQKLTYEQPGVGRVTISVQGSSVTYVSSVVLGSGFHAEVSDHGPEQVEVHFEGEESEYTFTASVHDGTLRAGFSGQSYDD
ncbi:MAG TPA: hypothetical protein VGB41_01680 [Acidimicrobiia bacterium]